MREIMNRGLHESRVNDDDFEREHNGKQNDITNKCWNFLMFAQ